MILKINIEKQRRRSNYSLIRVVGYFEISYKFENKIPANAEGMPLANSAGMTTKNVSFPSRRSEGLLREMLLSGILIWPNTLIRKFLNSSVFFGNYQ